MGDSISIQHVRMKQKRRVRMLQGVKHVNLNKRSVFYRHIYFLLQSTMKDKPVLVVPFFLLISLSMFGVTTLFIFINTYDFVLSVVIGGFVGIFPYLTLLVRLRSIRNAVGNNFLHVIQLLVQNYTANSEDTYQTLVTATEQIKDKTIKRMFTNLISEMQVSRVEEDLKKSIDLFIYTSGTSWSKRLGNIIMKGYLYDENILNALVALSNQMEKNEMMLEEEKSESFEPIINGYFTAPVFIASIFLGWHVTGPRDWFKLQFENQYSFITFMLALSFTVISLFVSLILKNPKNDI